MQILSALDAVTPAIARTRLVLFTPFRAGRTWKLSVTAYLAFAGTVFMPFPLLYLGIIPFLPGQVKGPMTGILIAASAVLTLLYAFIFYLCSRLDFAFFDIVLNRGEFVAPAWRKYGPQSIRWTAVKAALSLLAMLAMTSPLLAYMHNMLTIMKEMSKLTPGQPPPPEFFSEVFAGYGLIMLLFGSLFLVMVTLDAFIVPSLALENVSLTEAFRRLGGLIRREPGQFFAFVTVKTGIAIAGYIGLIFAMEIVIFILIMVLAAVLGLAGLLLHLIGVPTPLLLILALIIGALLYGFILVYGLALAIGPLFTFTQAYTLYFLGGRYPLLGDLLDRSTPPPVPPAHTYPPMYSPAAYTVAEPTAPPPPRNSQP